mmetsp:Transcript_64644/g.154321  ORF Transcript_64644/g.154321 Transcript_64644/m.154321 type:complete len:212 (+) Transcript_64644:247-882(+)
MGGSPHRPHGPQVRRVRPCHHHRVGRVQHVRLPHRGRACYRRRFQRCPDCADGAEVGGVPEPGVGAVLRHLRQERHEPAADQVLRGPAQPAHGALQALLGQANQEHQVDDVLGYVRHAGLLRVPHPLPRAGPGFHPPHALRAAVPRRVPLGVPEPQAAVNRVLLHHRQAHLQRRLRASCRRALPPAGARAAPQRQLRDCLQAHLLDRHGPR